MNKILFNLIFFLLFFLLIDLYFWQSIKNNDLFIIPKNKLFKYLYWLISLFCIVTLYITIVQYHKQDSPKVFVIIRSIILSIYLTKFISIVPLIIDDLYRSLRYFNSLIFESPSKSSRISRLKFLQNFSLIIFFTILPTLLWGIFFGRHNFKKYFVNVKINKWPKKINGLKIIQLSDLHLGSFTSKKPIEKIVNIINDEKPDLFVFTGDLVNNYYWESYEYIDILKKIKSKHGKFSILGNHDYGDYLGINKKTKKGLKEWNYNLSMIKKVHKKLGFKLLLNENVEMKIKNCYFNLIGIENWGSGRFSKYGDLSKSTKNINNLIPSILLSHDPSSWEKITLKHTKKIDLQLSGHTHGFQIGIELKNFKWSPSQLKYKQWAGLYKKNKSQIYVNRGVGYLGYAGRVGINPEISVIKIFNG